MADVRGMRRPFATASTALAPDPEQGYDGLAPTRPTRTPGDTEMTSLRYAVALAAVLAIGCDSDDYTITLVNDSNTDFVPYPVVTDPPPPHREADTANTLADGQQESFVPSGFNPAYYHAQSKRGFFLQLGLDDDPPQILFKLMQFVVPPGQEGTDPANQPTELYQELYEPQGTEITITVRRLVDNDPVEFSEP